MNFLVSSKQLNYISSLLYFFNFLQVILLVTIIITLNGINAGLINDPTVILQGPSSKTTLIGPDGSRILSYAPGGKIVHSERPGYIARTGHEDYKAEIISPAIKSSLFNIRYTSPHVTYTTTKSTEVVTPVVFNQPGYNFEDEEDEDDYNDDE